MKAVILITLFFTSFSYGQVVSDNLSWAPQNAATSIISPVFNLCNEPMTYTISSIIGFKNVTASGNPNLTNGIVTPGYIYDPSLSIPMTITFSKPVCNLRILFEDLDGNQNESLGSVSPDYNNLTDVVGSFFDPTGAANQVNSTSENATGWVEWNGPLTSISFNYNRPGPGCGLVINSIEFECCDSLVISLPADTTICLQGGNSFTITPNISGATSPIQYLWSDNSTGSSLSITNSGIYWVEVSDCCFTQRDSIVVTVNSFLPDVQLISSVDTCIQSQESISLVPTFSYAENVFWSDGTIGDQLTVSNSGSYTVYCSNVCGTDSATCLVTLNSFPELNLPTILDTCFDAGVGFAYTANGSTGLYQWVSGSQTATEWITQEGIYTCNLTNQCGSISDSMLVQRSITIDLYIPEDSIVECGRLPFSLLNIGSNYDLEIISPSEELIEEYLEESGWYTIHVFNSCGERWDSIYVDVQNEQFFYMPNSFTPNKDFDNERFEFEGENISIREIQIFNRWGQEVYTENESFSGWDGNYQGKECPNGVYIVRVIYENCLGMPTVFHGHVNLLR